MSRGVILGQLFPGTFFVLAQEAPAAIAPPPEGAPARHFIGYRKLRSMDPRISVPAGFVLVSHGCDVLSLAADTEVTSIDL